MTQSKSILFRLHHLISLSLIITTTTLALTIGFSTLLSTGFSWINIVIGCCFLLIALLCYLRHQTFQPIIIPPSATRFLYYESALLLLLNLCMGLFLMGALYRVFFEKMSVFD